MNKPITVPQGKKFVIVLFNEVGEDWYEKLKQVDISTLPFKPEYKVHVETVKEEYEAIVKALRSSRYRVFAINLKEDLGRLERVLKRIRPDVIFNLVESFHDVPDLEAAVTAMFDLYRIRYTGSGPFALELCQDKVFTKRTLLAHEVPTPRFRTLTKPELPDDIDLNFPLIVKPTFEDASAGIDARSVVHDARQLEEQVNFMFDRFDASIFVEEFINGPELHVAVWGNESPEVLPPVEYDFSQLPADYPPIISYAAKWNPLDEVYHRIHSYCPPRVSEETLRKVADIAKRAYTATFCSDYARIDMRLKGDEPYVLEVNPNPELTEDVSFMDSAARAGYSFAESLSRIVEFALAEDVWPLPKPELAVPEFPLPGVPADPDSTRLLTSESGSEKEGFEKDTDSRKD